MVPSNEILKAWWTTYNHQAQNELYTYWDPWLKTWTVTKLLLNMNHDCNIAWQHTKWPMRPMQIYSSHSYIILDILKASLLLGAPKQTYTGPTLHYAASIAYKMEHPSPISSHCLDIHINWEIRIEDREWNIVIIAILYYKRPQWQITLPRVWIVVLHEFIFSFSWQKDCSLYNNNS